MNKSTLVIDTPKNCGDCPFCIFTAEEKRYIGYCNTSDDDYYCKLLDRFMDYDEVDGGVDILGKPAYCPLQAEIELVIKIPEEKYQGILNMAEEILDASTFCSPRYLYKAVLNGTPLPKGHSIKISEK